MFIIPINKKSDNTFLPFAFKLRSEKSEAVNIPSEISLSAWINLYNGGGGVVKKVPEEEEAQEELT